MKSQHLKLLTKLIILSLSIFFITSCDDGSDDNIEPQKETTEDEVSIIDEEEEQTVEETIHTTVSISGDKFLINGKLTFEGREWNGYDIEGLLPNSRMVNGIFDDTNEPTADSWAYPDSDEWDPNRNTEEFVAAMESWYTKGLLSFTINLQGGSPMGYGNSGWVNSAFNPDGSLDSAYMSRLELILDEADRLGMVPIVGFFYFGQDQYLNDETAVKAGVENAVNWLFDKGYKNVLIEINNECNGNYDHDILFQYRVHELITLAQSIERDGHRYPVSTSYTGKHLPKSNVVEVADFIILHGNGMEDPDEIVALVNETKTVNGYDNQPIIYNEDDNYGFENDWNNFVAATSVHASWGFFDYRRSGEEFENGFQSIPADWEISSDRKQAFFNLLEEITNGNTVENVD